MDKTHYERRSHEQGNYEIIPTYSSGTSEGPIIDPGEVIVTPGGEEEEVVH